MGEFRYAVQYKLIFVPQIILCHTESRLPSFEHYLNVGLVNYPCSNHGSTASHSAVTALLVFELSSLAITRGGCNSKMASARGRTHILLTGSPGILHIYRTELLTFSRER